MKRLATMLLSFAVLGSVLAAQTLTARIDRDQIRIAAPRLHFVAGAALDRLRDGATVNYDFQLTARTDKNGKLVARSEERFAVSYDLWEEKFAITKLGPSPRSVSHLSAAAAEAWCVENTSLPISSLSANQSFWLRLDYRVEDSPASAEQPDNSGFTLSGLIDIFGRKTRGEQLRGFEEVGPLRLDNLKRR